MIGTSRHVKDDGLLRCREPVQAPRAVPHYNFLRKPASDFGWDWGPAFAPAGLGGVTLVGDQGLEILGAQPWPCDQDHSPCPLHAGAAPAALQGLMPASCSSLGARAICCLLVVSLSTQRHQRGGCYSAGVSVRQDHVSEACEGNVLLFFDVLLEAAAGACTLEVCALDGPSSWTGGSDVQGEARHATVTVRPTSPLSTIRSLHHAHSCVRQQCASQKSLLSEHEGQSTMHCCCANMGY